MAKLLLLGFTLLLALIHGQQGCFVEERVKLLEFNAFVKSNAKNQTFANQLLSSWGDDPEHSDCCQWERVRCNSTTGRVIQLSLDNLMEYPEEIVQLISLPQMFEGFDELRILNLSGNWIREKEGSSSLLRLPQLETVDLATNYFGRGLLRSLSAVTSLKNLNLSQNDIEGSFPAKELANLTNLEVLDLSYNNINGGLPIQDLGIFRRLEILDLSWNSLVGNVPLNVGEMASLKALSLAWNRLNGTLPIPIPGFCQLKRLQELDLIGNSFEGVLPPCLYNLTSLRFIDLRYNYFEGPFSFSSFENHSKLEEIMLTCNDGRLKIDAEYLSQNPSFQLKVLALSHCSLNSSDFLHHQRGLKIVDLSYNNLNGTFPSWLLENNGGLQVLKLNNNFLTGPFFLPRNPLKNIIQIDVSKNRLNGPLGSDFGKILSNLKFLDLSNNHFEGYLPSSISTMRELEQLVLSFNNFSGQVPKELLLCCTELEMLVLSHNKLGGDIFGTHFNLSGLTVLDLSDNMFTGSLLPNSIHLPSLSFFNISNNYFTGKIPSWIGDSPSLETLALQNNSFEGPFPCEKPLQAKFYLDLSHNSISGSLPSCFDPMLQYLNLEGNNFTGSITNAFLNFTNLRVLNLRDNSLSGNIPDKIASLSSLIVFILGKNHLSGLIPMQLCRLKNIGFMDLSNNFFNGPIPPCFNNITFGKLEPRYSIGIATWYEGFALSKYEGYEGLLHSINYFEDRVESPGQFQIDFVTKNRVNSYKGAILNFMFGLDLSCNNLIGKIPSELGGLSTIHALNLSHNQLIGVIPISFSGLSEIESLDLSFNNLSGKIPSELINLNFLEVFNVTHNNLSGRIPYTGRQLWTFEENSYGENPLLCGLPLKKNCTTEVIETPHLPMTPLDETEGKWYEIDPTFFRASFAATYLTFLLFFVTVLFINPVWRRRWFDFVENCIWSSRYFVSDALRKLSSKCIR